MIALHGAAVNAASLLPLQRALGEGVEVLLPDLPGHGSRRDKPFRIATALGMINDLIRNVAADVPIVLVGDSLGGYLALLAAAKAGSRVQAVVAGGASFDMRGFGGQLVGFTDIAAKVFGFLAGPQRLERLFGWLAGRMTDPETVAAIMQGGLRFEARSESITALRQVNLMSAIQACVGRVYLVNGALDIPAVWYTRKFAAYARDGYAVVIPFAGHACALSHPVEFADVVHTAIAAAQAELIRRTRVSA